MSKKKSIIKWSLLSVVSLAGTVVGFGYWFMSLIPTSEDLSNIKNTTIQDLPYLSENVRPHRGKILAVVTSTSMMGNTNKKTGYELTELSRAYYVFQANGFEVEVASPLGGEPPVIIDNEDMGPFDYAFMNDPTAQRKAKNTIAIEEIEADDYSAVYFVGGKGAMFDFPQNHKIQEIVQRHYESNKVIGAVCHGPAALINVTLADGTPLLTNKTVSSFTNSEELFLIPDAPSIFPFLLQDKLIEKGASFSDGVMYLKNVVRDGNLVTGQNPWSTWTVAETMISQLGFLPKKRNRTLQENTIDILATYESQGYSQAKAEIEALYLDRKMNMDRTLLAMHGIVATMQWDLGKFIDLIRLLSYTKSISGGS